MESEPPSVVPRVRSVPPEPGSAAFRSSSAPTTSVAPPAMSPGLLWPCARLALACCMLVLRAAAAVNSGSTPSEAGADVTRALGTALIVAGLPLLLPRYRSLRAFSWVLLIVTFLELYLTRDRLIG
ncbi:MAG: hypothetical protein ABW061_11590 [Polyangiaceae bacterium]